MLEPSPPPDTILTKKKKKKKKRVSPDTLDITDNQLV